MGGWFGGSVGGVGCWVWCWVLGWVVGSGGGVLGWVVGWLGAVGECRGVRSFRFCISWDQFKSNNFFALFCSVFAVFGPSLRSIQKYVFFYS